MSLFVPRRSALGGLVLSTLGARKIGAAPATVQSRDFLEFISKWNSGTGLVYGTLRVHGDEEANMDAINGLYMYNAANRSTEHHLSIGGSVSFSFDSATTNTVGDGAINVDTPYGVTTIDFGESSAWTAVYEPLRIMCFAGSLFREHWLDLTETPGAAGQKHYIDARQVLWNEANITESASAPMATIDLCGGGTYTTQAGDKRHQWVHQSAEQPSDDLVASLMWQWAVPTNTIDFTGILPCAGNPTYYQTHADGYARLTPGRPTSGYVLFDPGGALTFPAPGWHYIVDCGPYAWPAFQ